MKQESEKGKRSASLPHTIPSLPISPQSLPVLHLEALQQSPFLSSHHHSSPSPVSLLSLPNIFPKYLITLFPMPAYLKKNCLCLLTIYDIKFLIMIYKGLHSLHLNLPFQPCPWPLCTIFFFFNVWSDTFQTRFYFDFNWNQSEISWQKKLA